MIASLDDARRWYEGVKALAQDMARLGRRYWDIDPLAGLLAQDNRFRSVDSSEVDDRARTVLRDLDDLGVLLMFSVFEAIVRERALIDVDASLPAMLHPAVGRAVDDLRKEIRGGSFGRVTDAFRAIGPGLVEEVDQVRRYRNWVAHGRSGEQPSFVDPPRAYDRLSRFLARMSEVAAPDSLAAGAKPDES